MKKKAVILFGSPHTNGATNEITVWAKEHLEKLGYTSESIHLYGKKIQPCMGCGVCQKTEETLWCMQKDDVAEIANKVLEADLILIATPIYSSFCTAPTKALLDRLVYMMNKYLGRMPEDWHSLWESKHLAMLISYAVKYDEILEPLDMGMKIYCKHSKLFYDGYLAIHRKNFMLRKASGNSEEFGDKARVEDFIDHIIQSCETKKVATWSAVTGK